MRDGGLYRKIFILPNVAHDQFDPKLRLTRDECYKSRLKSVKRSIPVDVGAAASVKISSFAWLLGNKKALRLIVINIIGKKKQPSPAIHHC